MSTYAQYYLQARDAADKIAAKEYEGPVKTDTSGFMARKEETEQESSDPSDMVLGYLAGIRKSVAPQPDFGGSELAPTSSPRPQPGLSGPPIEGDTKQALEALAAVESRGSGDYEAVGPEVKKGMYAGDRAYGRYQVMGKNIPSWTKEILGTSMTPEEFIRSPEAQDAVAAYRMNQAKEKHGTWEDAASVWFSGRPLKDAGNASDGYMTVPGYVHKFRKYMRTT
jgi:hypothetical protein